MFENIIPIIILILTIILLYSILFWFVKQFSEVIIEYDSEDKKGKKEIIISFILYSAFIIAPSYIILSCIIKLFEYLYK